LECKTRDINTPEVKDALDSLERYIWPKWLIPQFRHRALEDRSDNDVEREGQQQVLRATLPGIRDSVKELIGKHMDSLAQRFVRNHDIKIKEEIERMNKEYGQLKEPWVFVVR
jgi:hypothetical protein